MTRSNVCLYAGFLPEKKRKQAWEMKRCAQSRLNVHMQASGGGVVMQKEKGLTLTLSLAHFRESEFSISTIQLMQQFWEVIESSLNVSPHTSLLMWTIWRSLFFLLWRESLFSFQFDCLKTTFTSSLNAFPRYLELKGKGSALWGFPWGKEKLRNGKQGENSTLNTESEPGNLPDT